MSVAFHAVTWEPLGSRLHRHTTTDSQWTLIVRDTDVCDVKLELVPEDFMAAVYARRDHEPQFDAEYWRLSAYVSDQEVAKTHKDVIFDFTETLMRGNKEDGDARAILSERLVPNDSGTYQLRLNKSDYLSVFVKERSIWVTLQQGTRSYWENLLMVYSGMDHYDSDFHDYTFPPHITDPLAIGARYLIDKLIPMIEAKHVWSTPQRRRAALRAELD